MYNQVSATDQQLVPAEQNHGGRLTLKYDDPNAGLRVKLKASYSHDHADSAYFSLLQHVCANAATSTGPFGPNAFTPYDNCKADLYSFGAPNSLPYSATGNFSPTNVAIWNTNTPNPIFKNGQP